MQVFKDKITSHLSKAPKFIKCLFMISILAIAGCGGGGGGSGSGGDEPVIIGTGASLRGVAAEGGPLANKPVVIKALQGKQATGQTLADGTFSDFELINEAADGSQYDALVGPYLARVEKDAGEFYYSIAHRSSSTKGVTEDLYLNIHPFTDLILRNWFAIQGENIESTFADQTAINNLPTQQQIADIEKEIKAIIVEALAANASNELAVDFKLFTSEFSANGVDFDRFLDNSAVKIINQVINVNIVDSETSIQTKIIKDVDLDADFTDANNIAPTDPENPRALVASVSPTEGEVVVFWGESTDDKGVAGYNIYRNGEFIDKSPYPVFVDSGLPLGETYMYEIEAVDGRGLNSARVSASVTVDEPDTTAPPPSTGLGVVENSSVIELSWNQDNIGDVAGFKIIRNSNSDYATVTSTTFTDYDVVLGEEYCYQIVTFDGAGNESAAAPVSEICETINGSDDIPPAPPSASAGSDQAILLGQQSRLNGTASSDPNGDTLIYSWSILNQPAGANASLDDPALAEPMLSTDLVGSYEVQLSVFDGSFTDTDSILVTVSDGDQDGDGLSSSVELSIGLDPNLADSDGNGTDDGLEDFDADGISNGLEESLGYAIDNDDSDNNGVLDGDEDRDGDGFSNADEIAAGSDPNNNGSVPSDNSLPTSDAGPDQTVILGQAIALNGSASTDPDGDSITYQWSIANQPSGATANLDDAQISQPSLSVDTLGTYELALEVSDGSLIDTDTVVITVIDGDQDSDQLPSSIEIPIGLDPNDPDTDDNGTADGDEDFDNDGFTNAEEVNAGTDLADADSRPYYIDFTVKSSPVVPGGHLNYVVTLGNSTVNTTFNNLLVELTLPTGISFNRLTDVAYLDSNSHSGCSSSGFCDTGDQVFWSIVSLAPGESITIDIDADIDVAVVAGTQITTNASFSADEFSSSIEVNRTVDIVAEQLIGFTLVPSKDPVLPGESFSYELHLGNASNTSLSNSEIRLELPVGLSIDQISDGGTESDNVVTWNVASLAAADSLVRTVDVTLDSGVSIASTLTAIAELRHDGGLGLDRQLTSSISVSDPLPLTVDYQLLSTPVLPGGQMTYAITVSNTSVATLINNVGIEIRVPTGVSFNRLTDVAYLDSSSHRGCASSGFCDVGDEVFWLIDSLAAGESVTLNIEADIAVDVIPGSLIDAPVFVDVAGLGDSIHLQRAAAVVASQEIGFSLTPSKDPVSPGESFSYRIDLGNASNTVLSNADIRLELPADLTVDQVSNGGTNSGNVVTWNIASLGATDSLMRTVDVTLDSGATIASTLTAIAELRHDGGLERDRQVTAGISVSDPLLLEVNYELISSPVVDGMTYAITVSNTSIATLIPDVGIEIRVPTGVSFNRLTDVAYLDSSSHRGCASSGFCDAGDEVFWSITSLAAGESVTLNIEADVDMSLLPGQIIEAPVFVYTPDIEDSIYLQRTAAVVLAQDIVFTLTPSKDPVSPGESFSYQVDLGNASNNVLSNAGISLELPAGLTVDNVSDGGTDGGNVVTWDIASLAAADSLVRTVDVTLDSGATIASTLTAIAELRHDGGLELDRQLTSSVSVSDPLSLAVDYRLLSAPVSVGGKMTYAITVGNTSVATLINNVAIEIRVPTDVSFNRLTDVAYLDSSSHRGCASNGFCDAGDEVFWSIASLAAGESITLNIEADVAASVTPGSLIVAPVFVNADGLEDSIYLQRTAAVVANQPIAFSLTPSQDPVSPGNSFSYQIDLGNASNTVLSNAEISLELPAGLSVDQVNDGGSNSGNIVTWSVASLSVSDSLVRTVDVTLDANATIASTLMATAGLRHDGGLERDRQVAAPVSVNSSLLALTTTVEATENPGNVIDITITLENTSANSTLNNVGFEYRVPESISFNRINDASPSSTTHRDCASNGFCDAGDEVFWIFPSLAAGASQVINISVVLDGGAVPGSIVTHPFFVTADELEDSIELQRTTRIVSP